MEEKGMEHKSKKVVESDAPRNIRRKPLGKRHENKSKRVGERKREKERLRLDPMGKMGGMRSVGGKRRRRGGEGNGKEDSRGKSKRQEPTYLKKTDEETGGTTKKDLQGRRRANARGQQLTEREFPPLATAGGGRTSCDVTQPMIPQDGNKRQAARKRKEEYRKNRELKAQMKKEKVALKEKKRKELEDTLRKKGERQTKNQPKLLEWFKRKGEGQQKTHTGGKKGVG